MIITVMQRIGLKSGYFEKMESKDKKDKRPLKYSKYFNGL